MNFCDKCGAIIAFANGSCPRCGGQAGGSKGPGMAGNNTFGSNPYTGNPYTNNPTAAKPQSGNLALIKKLERYMELLSENDELKSMIKPQNNFPTSLDTSFKKRSFIKYFWPFLVGGVVAASVIYLIVAIIIVVMTPSAVRAAQGYNMGDAFGGYVVAIIVAALIIFFGFKVAKRKQADFNNNAELMNREMTERYNKGLENQRMINLFQSNLTEMKQYEQLVPKDYRTYDKVSAIVELLKEDKVQSVEDAIILI